MTEGRRHVVESCHVPICCSSRIPEFFSPHKPRESGEVCRTPPRTEHQEQENESSPRLCLSQPSLHHSSRSKYIVKIKYKSVTIYSRPVSLQSGSILLAYMYQFCIGNFFLESFQFFNLTIFLGYQHLQ